jgi:hypothetical protein
VVDRPDQHVRVIVAATLETKDWTQALHVAPQRLFVRAERQLWIGRLVAHATTALIEAPQRNGVGVSSEPLRLLLLALSLLHPTTAVCNRNWHADGRSIHTDVRRHLLQPLYRRRGIS